MEKNTINITVSGTAGSGKTTIIAAIEDLLQYADTVIVSEEFDLLSGHRRYIAKDVDRLKNALKGKRIYIKEERKTISRSSRG